MKRALPFVIIVGVLGIILFVIRYLEHSAAQTPLTVPSESVRPGNKPSNIKRGSDPAQMLGATDATVMLEEFGDFECQSCGLLHSNLQSIKGEFGPRVVIVFREFPLVSKHAHALEAARAAEAAGLQGKFWEMHDLLYENQKTWHEASDVQPIFEGYASRIGLTVERFKRDLSSETVNQRIALDRERGYSIGVNSTPTVFLNGREVPPESFVADKLRALISAQIPPGSK
jgi:protein-disulfide isomerase